MMNDLLSDCSPFLLKIKIKKKKKKKKKRTELTLRFDFLHARQAVETRLFHWLDELVNASCWDAPSDVGEGAGTMYR